jgi:hypothetical protein
MLIPIVGELKGGVEQESGSQSATPPRGKDETTEYDRKV